jgi:hypothetical protein
MQNPLVENFVQSFRMLAFELKAWMRLSKMIKHGIELVKTEIPEEDLVGVEVTYRDSPYLQTWLQKRRIYYNKEA